MTCYQEPAQCCSCKYVFDVQKAGYRTAKCAGGPDAVEVLCPSCGAPDNFDPWEMDDLYDAANAGEILQHWLAQATKELERMRKAQ